MSQPTHGEILEILHEVQGTVGALADDVKATKEIVEAWTTAKTAGRFIIWLGKFLLAIGTLIVLAKGGFIALAGGK